MKTTMLLLGCILPLASSGADLSKPERPTAMQVIKLWSPELKTATDYHQVGASPERSPNVAAYSFHVVGPTIEELWNHYAVLCGMKQRYVGKTFQVIGDTGPNGSYVVADRWSGDGESGRGVSVFLLKTESYTVSVTFQPDPDRKSVIGSLTAVTSE